MNETVPRLTCDPNGLNVCANTNTVILYSQPFWYFLILSSHSCNELLQSGGSGSFIPLIFFHLLYNAPIIHDCARLLGPFSNRSSSYLLLVYALYSSLQLSTSKIFPIITTRFFICFHHILKFPFYLIRGRILRRYLLRHLV